MQNLEYEIKINIFKYVDYPLNLALTCRNWSVIAKDPYAKSEWIIMHYGEAHALFPTFVGVAKCQTSNQTPTERYKILNEGYNQLTNVDLPSKGNSIEDLILNKLIVFPLRTNSPQSEFTSASHIHQLPILKNNLLRQGNSLRPLTALTDITDCVGTRPSSRNDNQRRRQNQLARQRNMNRTRRRCAQLCAPINNNEQTLNRLSILPQQIVNDPLINQFFNGSPFV